MPKFPQDGENIKYILSSEYEEIKLEDLIETIKFYFPGVPADQITVDKMEIQVDCFGYDLYVPIDYRWYWIIERVVA